MRNFILFFFILLAAAQVSCNKTEKKDLSSSPSTLRISLADDPPSLDPRQLRSLKHVNVGTQIYEGLTRLDEKGIPRHGLAEKIEVSSDRMQYTFYLKPTTWSDGTPLTAHDFAEAWKGALNPSFPCDLFQSFYPIKNAKEAKERQCSIEDVGLTVVNDLTLKVELAYPAPYFLQLTASPLYAPLPRHVMDQNSSWAAPNGADYVCNGPFRVKSWTSQSQLILEKNPLYWDYESLSLDEIVFYITPDCNTEAQLFEKKETDWMGLPFSYNIVYEFLQEKRAEGKVLSLPITGIFWLKFNTKAPPFHNQKIRKAFTIAINRQEIIEHILYGKQSPALGPLPASVELHAPFFKDADVETAQLLFKEACEEEGWTPETFPQVTMLYNMADRGYKIVQYLQQAWSKTFDIPVSLDGLEYVVFRKRLRMGDYQVGPGDWLADFNDPIPFFELFKYTNDPITGFGLNDTQWHDEVFTELVESADRQIDLEKRKEMLIQAERILMEAFPVAPIYHYAFDYIKDPAVQDVVYLPSGAVDFKKAKIVR